MCPALRPARNAQQVLRSGVTSVAVPGGTWFIDVALRDAINAGLLMGPRIACAGQCIVTYGSIIDNEPSWVGTPEHSIGVLANNVPEMLTEVRRQCKHLGLGLADEVGVLEAGKLADLADLAMVIKDGCIVPLQASDDQTEALVLGSWHVGVRCPPYQARVHCGVL